MLWAHDTYQLVGKTGSLMMPDVWRSWELTVKSRRPSSSAVMVFSNPPEITQP